MKLLSNSIVLLFLIGLVASCGKSDEYRQEVRTLTCMQDTYQYPTTMECHGMDATCVQDDYKTLVCTFRVKDES